MSDHPASEWEWAVKAVAVIVGCLLGALVVASAGGGYLVARMNCPAVEADDSRPVNP